MPCFIWIFALAPWMERLEHAKRLKGGLAAVTAAVVGVIANLALWFALHVLFRATAPMRLGSWQIDLPQLTSFDWRAALLSALAAVLLFRAKWSIIRVLGVAALGGLALERLV